MPSNNTLAIYMLNPAILPKKHHPILLKRLSILLLLLSFSGCALYYQRNKLQDIDIATTTSFEKQTLAIELHFMVENRYDSLSYEAQTFADELFRQLYETGRFKKIKRKFYYRNEKIDEIKSRIILNHPDITLKVFINHSYDEKFLGWKIWVSALSLTLIPIKFNYDLMADITIERGNQNKIETYSFSDGMYSWHHILLLPLFFTTSKMTVIEQLRIRMVNNIINKVITSPAITSK